MTHLDDDLKTAVQASAVDADAHPAPCLECTGELARQLASPEVWQRETPPPPRQFMLNVSAFAERAREEEQAAAAICDELLTGPAAWWPQRLRTVDGATTAGMVKVLLERWRQMLQSSPANALQVTSLAIQIANALEVTAYPSDYVVKLRAQGYRDHAYVLLYMGRHPEALDFVERSRRLYEQAPLPEYDLARVATVKAAIILRHLDRFDEAAALVRASANTFLRYGDQTRYVNARMSEGAILYERGHVAEALAVWTSIDSDPALDDLGAVGLRHNIANCYADLGQPERAAEYVLPCIAQFELLGMETERTRSRWLLARTLVASGRHEDAIPVLRETWREFEQFDMISDAGLVALELAEALLIVGRPDDVPAICREAINQFTRAGMASRAITALSFLREAVAIGQAAPSLVRHVHAFLRELPKEQPRLSAPPPPGMGD